MSEGSRTGKLGVFISYARDDLDFADQLSTALSLQNFDITIDRQGISGGEDWQQRLGSPIRDADTVVFILSPSSAASRTCRWEVEEATRLGKRIMPLLCRPLEHAAPPPALASLNFIFFYAEPKVPGSGFGSGLVQLVTALNTDLEWLREHTRLLQRATEWQAGGRQTNRLLSGADIDLARDWAARRPKDAPQPTDLHLEFIRASEAWEKEQQNNERSRLEEMAAAQRREAEAIQRRDVVSRRYKRSMFAGLVQACALLFMAGWLYLDATQQREFAQARAIEALAATRQALAARSDALRNQSQMWADQAFKEIESGNATNGMLLALEALPDVESKNEAQRSRPFWAPARAALTAALRSAQERFVLSGHTADAQAVVVTPDGTRIVSVSRDQTIRIWDTATGAEKRALYGHMSVITSVAVSPDGASILTGSEDGTARLWDIETGNQLALFKGHYGAVTGVAFAPSGHRIATASNDRTVRIWETTTAAELGILRGHSAGVKSVAFFPDGVRIVTGSADHTARVWDARTGTTLWKLPGQIAPVNSVAVTADGKRVIAAAGNGVIQIWNIDTDDAPMVIKTAGLLGGQSVSVTPDGSTILTALNFDGIKENAISSWNAKTGELLTTIKVRAGAIFGVAPFPDGTRVAGAYGDGTVRVWTLKPNTRSVPFAGHTGFVRTLAVTPDSTRIVSGSEDGTARLWDREVGSTLAVLKGHKAAVTTVAISPDGSRIVTGSKDGTARVWDARTGAEIHVLNASDYNVGARDVLVAVVPDSSRIITAFQHNIRIWDAASGKKVFDLERTSQFVASLALSRDGLRIIAGYEDKVAVVWDVKAGKLVAELKGHNARVSQVALSRDGHRAYTASDDPTDSSARIWNVDTGATVARLQGHKRNISALALTSDERRVITASDDYTVRIWDAESGEPRHVGEHNGDVTSLAVTPDAQRVITISADMKARIWDIETGELLETLVLDELSLATAALVTPDGRQWITASGREIRTWEVLPSDLPSLMKMAKALVPRCFGKQDRGYFYLADDASSWCSALGKWPTLSPLGAAIAQATQLLQDGDDTNATKSFDRAIADHPADAATIRRAWLNALLDRGLRQLFAEQVEEAEIAFAKAQQMDPSSNILIEFMRSLNSWTSISPLVDVGGYDKANELIDKVLRSETLISRLEGKDLATRFFIFETTPSDPRRQFYASALDRSPTAIDDIVEQLLEKSPEAIAAAYERATAFAHERGLSVPRDVEAATQLATGDALYAKSDFMAAEKAYNAARKLSAPGQLIYARAGQLLWSVRSKLADQLIAEGRSLEGFVARWSAILGLTADVREALGPSNLMNNGGWLDIATRREIADDRICFHSSSPPTPLSRFLLVRATVATLM